MSPKRRSETICDSTLLTMAVVVPVAVSLFLYRREPKKLFQILFGVFVSFMVFVMLKHLWKIVYSRWKSKAKEEDVNPGVVHSPSYDQARKEAVSKAQEKQDERADDYERQIAGPRREQKLRELDDKMKSIRGLKDEGTPLGGSTRSSRLLQQSHDSQDESDEEDESGGWVTINLRLPDGSAKRKFRTSQKVKSLYSWLAGLGYSHKDYQLTTLLPRCPLTDRGKTLTQVGLVSDTTLAVDERD